MKKVVILILFFMVAITQVTFGATAETLKSASDLYDLGLFSGIGVDDMGKPNFDLDREPTRQEAIAMLVKLLGKENEAKNGKWHHPFKDVDSWADPYVGYAYSNGLTSGLSPTSFGSKSLVTANQYLTFILKALGYSSQSDFTWDKASVLSDKLRITKGEYTGKAIIYRGDIANISRKSLLIQTKHLQRSLLENLYFSNAIKLENIKKIGLLEFVSVQAISDHLEQYTMMSMIKRSDKLDFSDFIWRVVGKPTVLAVNDKKYFMSSSFVKDINGNYYVEIDGVAKLLSIAYDDYSVDKRDNPYVDGSVMEHSANYVKYSSEGPSINSTYSIMTFNNKDSSKSFKVIPVDYIYKDLRNPVGNYKISNDGYPPVVSLVELEKALGDFHVEIDTSDALDYYLIKITH